jgi:hypothetical protein
LAAFGCLAAGADVAVSALGAEVLVEVAPATETPVSPSTAATLADAIVFVNLMDSASPPIVMGS